jgi:hypothetical protein
MSSNIAKRGLATDPKAFLTDIYGKEAELLQRKLDLTDSISHDPTKGHVGEEHWIEILQKYLPRRFQVRSGIIMDSDGKTSDQIDVVIHDQQYTPTLLGQGSHGYILAEAVYAVFEVKPTLDKEQMEYAGDKVKSVRALRRTNIPTISSGEAKRPRPLFPIVGGILTRETSWKDGLESTPFRACRDGLVDDRALDCGCVLGAGSFDRFEFLSTAVDDPRKPGDWAVAKADVGLIFFLFRLLGWLNRVGTVPAVDWDKYAAIFRG